MPESLDDWFTREILSHEAAPTRYLTRLWPNTADVADIRHDTYIKVLEAAAQSRPHAPKSFLFSIARNLLADRARRTRIVAIDLMEDLDSLNVLVDELSPEHRVSVRQQLISVSAAFNQLPPKCREVVWMKRVQNLSHKDIAVRLGITIGFLPDCRSGATPSPTLRGCRCEKTAAATVWRLRLPNEESPSPPPSLSR